MQNNSRLSGWNLTEERRKLELLHGNLDCSFGQWHSFALGRVEEGQRWEEYEKRS